MLAGPRESVSLYETQSAECTGHFRSRAFRGVRRVRFCQSRSCLAAHSGGCAVRESMPIIAIERGNVVIFLQ